MVFVGMYVEVIHGPVFVGVKRMVGISVMVGVNRMGVCVGVFVAVGGRVGGGVKSTPP